MLFTKHQFRDSGPELILELFNKNELKVFCGLAY